MAEDPRKRSEDEPDSQTPRMERDGFRTRLERAVASLGMASHRSPWATLVVLAAFTAILASQLPRIQFLADVDRYLQPANPIRIQYDLLREQFGRDDFLLIAVTPERVFEPRFLVFLRDLHERLEDELPWVDEVQSLVNARQTRGDGDTLVVGELLEDWTGSAAELREIERIALANPLYRDLYLSSEGDTAGIVIRPNAFRSTDVDILGGFEDEATDSGSGGRPDLLTDAELAELVTETQRIVSEVRQSGVEIVVAGSPALNLEIQRITLEEIVRFSLLAFGAIAFLLLIVFRRLVAVVLPLAVVAAAMLCTLGLMAILGRPLTFVSQIVPSFLLAVGVGFSVHVLSIFFQRLDQGAERGRAIEGALGHSGPAIVMSSLTTAGGMLSFVPAGLLPVRDVGIFVPFGVLAAALFSITAVPAALAILPTRPRPRADAAADPVTERILEACGLFGTRHPIAVSIASFALLAALASGIPHITQEYDPVEWLPVENPVRQGLDAIDERLGGASGMEILFDSGRENGLHDPATLRRIESIQRYAAAAEASDPGDVSITKTLSLVDISKEIHQALHGGDPEEYRLAEDGRLVAQELLLFENAGSDDLEDVVDSQFRLARITLKAPQVGAGAQVRFMEAHVAPMRDLAGDASIEFTGFFALASTVAILVSQIALQSYVIAFLLVTPLMVFFIGSLRTGLVSMAPNLMPILCVLGVMGWAGMPLDTISVLIGGIALGLVVDDTIHILHGFRREFEATGDVEEATIRTMRTTGRALFFTTAVLTVAFAIYGLAEADTVSNFGKLTALAVLLAFLFDIFLSPALLALVYRRRGASD